MSEQPFEDPRDEYVHSRERISLVKLSKKWKRSGCSLASLRLRSQKENWPKQRADAQEKKRAEIDRKIIASTSTTAANEMTRIIEASRGAARLCKSAIDSHLAKLDEVEKKTGKPANPLNLSLAQAVDLLERVARINFIGSRMTEGGTGGTYEELLREALSKHNSVVIDLRVQAKKVESGESSVEVVKNVESSVKTNGSNGKNGSNGNGNAIHANREDRRFLL
jgi:hypothetical protein